MLETQWNEFAQDPAPRALRWLVDADEARLVDVFLATENEEVGTVPDLFVRFEEPFADARRHGFILAEALKRQYQEIQAGLRQEGIDATWVCPSPQPDETDTAFFVRVCGSFQAHYGELISRLAAVLFPAEVATIEAWQAWLSRLLRSPLPESVRLLILDDPSAPGLDQLAQAEPALLKTVKADLDMPAAYLDLARGEGRPSPGASFRRNFVALTQALANGDPTKAKSFADAAMAIAQEQQWPQMQVVVHMAMGAGFLGAAKIEEALGSYRAAGAIARTAAEQGDPAGPKLVLQGRLAEGAALVNAGRYPEAARTYEEAAQVAERADDHLMLMESWRMAAYCHEATKHFESGWRCGNLALDAAEKLEPETRVNATLPYVGQGLLRLLDQRDKGRWWLGDRRDNVLNGQELREQVRERMLKLAGPDWEQRLEPIKAAP